MDTSKTPAPPRSPSKEGKPSKPDEHNLVVALRVRPISEDEIIGASKPIAYAVDGKIVVLTDPMDDHDDVLRANRSREKNFVFDQAFDGAATQKEVYDMTAKFLIPGVVQGYNATVFAYGATGAGKTYTMLGTYDEPGIMARSLNDLFLEMQSTGDEMAYQVTMSYLEIYNEMIRDLLNPASGYLELREEPEKGVQVAGLMEVSATSTNEIMDILKQGNLERTSESTAANKHSSRSHAILQVNVKQRQRMRSVKQEVRHGRLFLIDLAGSERAANTHNTGKRMVEGAHINRSLLALGNCINALCDKHGARYVNYRDSKLTRLLKDALGGNCRTVMIAHISPASSQFEESRNTLVYADRAKNIKTKVRRNVMDVSYHIAQYTNIISELREEVKRLRVRLDVANRRPTAAAGGAAGAGGAALHDVNPQVERLKQQLLDVFREQMELRHQLVDINSTAMDIAVDNTSCSLVIKKWEREKALSLQLNNMVTSEEDMSSASSTAFMTEAKIRELQGSDCDEPAEVKEAREQLVALSRERLRAEGVAERVQQELAVAKNKALKLEEALPLVVAPADQREVLSLLCKINELEIENMELQSQGALKEFEVRKKDLVLMSYEQHRQLCDDIIVQQRLALLSARTELPAVESSKRLEDMYELWQRETSDLKRNFLLPAIEHPARKVSDLERNFLLPVIEHPARKMAAISDTLGTRPKPIIELESVSDSSAGDSSGVPLEKESSRTDAITLPASHSPLSHELKKTTSLTAKRSTERFQPRQISDSVSDSQRLFSRSPRTRNLIREERGGGGGVHGRRRSYHNLTSVEHEYAAAAASSNRPTTQHSIYTLHSNRTSPLLAPSVENESMPNIRVPTFNEESDDVLLRNPDKRRMVEANTRSIVARANTRRLSTKQQHDEINAIRQKQTAGATDTGAATKRFETPTNNKTFVSIGSTLPSEQDDVIVPAAAVVTPHSRAALKQRNKPILPSIDRQILAASTAEKASASSSAPTAGLMKKAAPLAKTRVQRLRRLNEKHVGDALQLNSQSAESPDRSTPGPRSKPKRTARRNNVARATRPQPLSRQINMPRNDIVFPDMNTTLSQDVTSTILTSTPEPSKVTSTSKKSKAGNRTRPNAIDAHSTKSQASQSSTDTDKSSRVIPSIPIYGTANIEIAGSSIK